MKLFIKTLKNTLLLIISCSLLFITPSDAVATSILIPPGTTDEAIEEVHELHRALGFEYMGRKLITPYSEESVDLCLEALKNKSLHVKIHGVSCLNEIVVQWDVPTFTLDKKIYPEIKALPEGKFPQARFTRWNIQFKQLSSEEERLRFLRSVLMDSLPGEPSSQWEEEFRTRAVKYLIKMVSDDAKGVLQDALELEENRTGKEPDEEFIENIRVSIDEINLRQRLQILIDPVQQVAEIKFYLIKHRELAKQITEEEIKKRGRARIHIRIRHHHVVWPIHKLRMMDELIAINVLKEVWSDPRFSLKQRGLAQSILLKLEQIEPEEAVRLD